MNSRTLPMLLAVGPWLAASLLLSTAARGGDEPALPAGLGAPSSEEPALPSGLGDDGADTWADDGWADEAPLEDQAWTVTTGGFVEGRLGIRTRDDDQKDASIGELRAEGGLEAATDRFRGRATIDLLYDALEEDPEKIDLETGEGFVDLREAWISARATHFLDVKLGRQILTWGTGDLLFINDLFPKDWESYFLGRDTDYLKAPSDAGKFALFSGVVNLDLIYVPRFDPDRFIDGNRISFYNPAMGAITGRSMPIDAARPDRWFEDDELAARVYTTVEGIELALYGYRGFWKSPAGQDPTTGEATFPALSVIGASARAGLGPGLASGEMGFYLSEDDTNGTDPFVRNSEVRGLIGYEQEVAQELTLGLQYYVEWRLDHEDFLTGLPPGAPRPDEFRHLVTLRLTQMMLQQTLSLGIFAYFSPNELDTFLRPRATYRFDDHWTVEGGANLFYGRDVETFFGQFQQNSNVYLSLHYDF